MYDKLLQYYLDEFTVKGEPALVAICNCKVPSDVILTEYAKLPPIEEMSDKEKKEMKAYVIGLFPTKSIEEKLKCCKVIYAIGTLL